MAMACWSMSRGCARKNGPAIWRTRQRRGTLWSAPQSTAFAFQRTIHELPEPLLQRMSDMMLIELGMALAKVARKPQRSPLN